jgi:hypothetical protein
LSDSPAIPVSQPLLDACSLKNEVEVEAHGNCLIIRSPAGQRERWDEAFRKMASNQDDKLLLNDAPPKRWDNEEWEW